MTRGRGRLALLAGGLVLAWLLPLASHLLRLDWLLPPLIWLLTAALLRAGHTLLDRLVLAAGLLAGTTAAAGLLLSYWPWRLAPVPVAGAALTVLVLVAFATRRRPALPRPRRADVAAPAAGLLAAAVVGWPFLGADPARRFALALPGEDLARHFSLYDTIGLLGRYGFVDRSGSAPYLLEQLRSYPQGSHLLHALLDGFLRSGAPARDAMDSWQHYLGFHIAGYAGFAVAVLWAMRRVAGPGLSGWPKLALYTFAASSVGFGGLVALFVRGYPSEILGLTLFAILLALLARPPVRTRELIVVAGALLVGIGWAYFFLLPFAGLAGLAALVGYRRRLRPHLATALVTAAVTVPLAFVPYAVTYAGRGGALGDLLPGGPVVGADRGLAAGLAALLLAGIAVAPGSPARRMVGVQLVLAGAVTLALGGYQIAATGQLSYYFDKAVHALFVTCLVGLGAAAPLLARLPALGSARRPGGTTAPTPGSPAAPGPGTPAGVGPDSPAELRPGSPATTPAGLARYAVATVACFGLLTVTGAVPTQRPAADKSAPMRHASWGVVHATGTLRNQGAGNVVAAVLRRYPKPDGRVTEVVYANPDASYLVSMFVSVLHRDYGTRARHAAGASPLYRSPTGVTIPDHRAPRRIIVVNSPATARDLRALLTQRPDLDIDLVTIHVPHT